MATIDEQVIGCLLKNARATYAEIGGTVGLSAPAVKRRVDRLVASGAIRGFTALIDPGVLGWTTEAYVELYCKGTVSPHELRRSLEAVPEVISACTVSGSADALVHMLATDIRHLERVRDHPHVDHTQSVIVLSGLLDRPRSQTTKCLKTFLGRTDDERDDDDDPGDPDCCCRACHPTGCGGAARDRHKARSDAVVPVHREPTPTS